MSENKNTTKKNWVDPDDAPELTQEWFRNADLYDGSKLIRRGRPRKEQKKVSLHISVDPSVANYLRATGKGWQTRLNAFLSKAVAGGLV